MKKGEIQITDWQRILLGQAPLEFLVEVVVRTLIVYLVLVLAMRLLGKRMNAQLSVAELSVMIMLGGIVSVPMQVPDRGILHGVLVLSCMVGLYRGINGLAFRFRRVEQLTQGHLHIVVTDGVLDLHAMTRVRLARAVVCLPARRRYAAARAGEAGVPGGQWQVQHLSAGAAPPRVVAPTRQRPCYSAG